MKLDELRAIVTGAASGLGREFALSLCGAGAKVAGLDIDAAGLEEVARAAAGLPGSFYGRRTNVARQEEAAQGVADAVRQLGPVNSLINNAGIYKDGLLVKELEGQCLKMPLSQWQAVIDTDLTGSFLMAREVAAQMVQQRTRPGVIVNISSISHRGNAGQSNYSAAKAGLLAVTRVWAGELAPHGIRVAAIAPGFIDTPILEAMSPEVREGWIGKVPLKRLGRPAEISLGLRFIIECDYFNGRCLEIDGGLTLAE